MADNIGNVNIALGIDKVKLEADLREVERELGRINDQFKNMGSGVSVKDQLTAKMNELRKAFDLLPMAQKNEKGLADVNSAANKLLQKFLQLKTIRETSGLSLDEYSKKVNKALKDELSLNAAIGREEQRRRERALKGETALNAAIGREEQKRRRIVTGKQIGRAHV